MTGSDSFPALAHPVNVLGLRFDRRQAEARACCLSFDGPLTKFAPEILGSAAESIHADVLRHWQKVERADSNTGMREEVSSSLATMAIRLIDRLFAETGSSGEMLLAIGIHGAGIWDLSEGTSPTGYSELIPSAVLAEQTGLTIVDDFPARDLAQGGNGFPVEVHGLWTLLTDRTTTPGRSWRALLEVSSDYSRFTLVGPPDADGREDSIFSCDLCVGSRLFVELSRASQQQVTVDVDKLATSGRVIPELEELWLATTQGVPVWQPEGQSALPLIYALKNSIYETAPLENQLATATRFLARKISDFVKHGVPASKPVGELFVMGDGSRNGLLLHHLNELLVPTPIRRLSEIGHDRTIHAASIAALAYLHILQIPIPSTGQGAVRRVAGRLTPGTPSNWSRILTLMTHHAPWLLPLRDAI